MNQINPIIAQMANAVKLKVNSPEAAAKVQDIAEAYGQQAAAQSQIQQDNNIEQAVQQRKQSIFMRPVKGQAK